MRLSPTQLNQHLEKKIESIYLLYGIESFLIEESAKLIRKKILNQFDNIEQEILHLESADGLTSLAAQIAQPSLFALQRLIEIRFNAKFTPKEMENLTSILMKENSHFFILRMGSLSKQQQQAPWFLQLQQKGVIVPHWGLSGIEFSKWVSFQAQQRKLKLNEQTLASLINATEGNPLAAYSELDRLALLALSQDEMESTENIEGIERRSQFEVFDLCAAALSGQVERTIKIVCRLNEIQTAPQLLIWALSQSLRALLRCTTTVREDAQRQFLQQAGILASTHPIYLKALKSPRPERWLGLLSELSTADRQFKSGETLLGQRTLFDVCFKLASPNEIFC